MGRIPLDVFQVCRRVLDRLWAAAACGVCGDCGDCGDGPSYSRRLARSAPTTSPPTPWAAA